VPSKPSALAGDYRSLNSVVAAYYYPASSQGDVFNEPKFEGKDIHLPSGCDWR